MTRARIIVSGNVQGIGYRALVRYSAGVSGVSGLVRNLYDSKRRVEIFCEGPKDDIVKFLRDTDVKAKTENITTMNVKKMDTYWEGDKDFKEAWKTYSGFEIDYGVDKPTPYERENLESLEMAKFYFADLKNSVNSMRIDANDNFGTMAGKYGKISKELKSTKKEISRELISTKKDLKKSIEELPQGIADAVAKSIDRSLKT